MRSEPKARAGWVLPARSVQGPNLEIESRQLALAVPGAGDYAARKGRRSQETTGEHQPICEAKPWVTGHDASFS